MGAQKLAEAVAEQFYSRDNLGRHLGIVLQEIRPGYARMSMKVREEMLNSHGICHGGILFCLADTAFAYACNSRNASTVASGGNIDFVAPAQLGDELTVVAEEQVLSGRTGVYDMVVYGPDGKRLAMLRGKSYRIRGEVVPAGENE